jgi:hypothetical protein
MPTLVKIRICLFVAGAAVAIATVYWRDLMDEHEVQAGDWDRGYRAGRFSGLSEAQAAAGERAEQLLGQE